MDTNSPKTLACPESCNFPEKAFVVFVDTADLPWQRLLKSGFRHCFLVLQFKTGVEPKFLFLDSMVGRTAIFWPKLPADFDPYVWFISEGARVLRVDVPPISEAILPLFSWHRFMPPLRIFSCVELIKQMLGIGGFGVLTPYQLYCHLRLKTKSGRPL